MPNPTQQQLDQWWDGLQASLNKANAHIDLANPADLIRFRVVEINVVDREETDAEVKAYFPFADNKDLNMNEMTDDDLITAQKPGKPSQEKLTELYIAAQEGRLFVNSLPELFTGVRQVVVNKEGNAEVWPDFKNETMKKGGDEAENETPEEKAKRNLVEDMMVASRSMVPPKKPKKIHAGIGNRIAAFFGSSEARIICDNADNSNRANMQKYREEKADWDRKMKMDPDFVRKIESYSFSSVNYFHDYGFDVKERELRVQRLGTKAHKQPLIDGILDMTKANTKKNAEKLSDMMKKSDQITPEAAQLIAKICYQMKQGKYVLDEYNNDMAPDMNVAYTMTEDALRLAAHEAVEGSREYRNSFDAFCKSDSFRITAELLTEKDIQAFADNPEAAADKVFELYQKCATDEKFASEALKTITHKQQAKEFNDVKQSFAADNRVNVKPESKDFDAASNRPKLDEVEAPKLSKDDAQPRI